MEFLPHHRYTDETTLCNKMLAREFGSVGDTPRIQWKLTTEIFVDAHEAFRYRKHDVAPPTSPIETAGPVESTESPLEITVAESVSTRISIADINDEVIWVLGHFKHQLGNQHELYLARLGGCAGISDTSKFSYNQVPNTALDVFDWPDENLTTCMIYLVKNALQTLPEWERARRLSTFKKREAAYNQRRDFLRDKLSVGNTTYIVQPGAPVASKTAGPVVLVP